MICNGDDDKAVPYATCRDQAEKWNRGMTNERSFIVLEARRLTKAFFGFVAVDAVDLKVRRGHIHALIGPNGAGKTTCFNLLRSEEHTSELQSLMRISYAVFCLKKKKINKHTYTNKND